MVKFRYYVLYKNNLKPIKTIDRLVKFSLYFILAILILLSSTNLFDELSKSYRIFLALGLTCYLIAVVIFKIINWNIKPSKDFIEFSDDSILFSEINIESISLDEIEKISFYYSIKNYSFWNIFYDPIKSYKYFFVFNLKQEQRTYNLFIPNQKEIRRIKNILIGYQSKDVLIELINTTAV